MHPLSNMMKPLAILLRLAQDVNHPFVQSMQAVHTAPLSHLVAAWGIRLAVKAMQ